MTSVDDVLGLEGGPIVRAGAGRSVLDVLLHPESLAIIGASDNPVSLGGRPLGLLAAAGYAGRVYPVNPTRSTVQGRPAYPSVRDLPEPVEVAMVMVRARMVPAVLRECDAAGVRVAIVLSSGFGEGTGRGAELRDEIADIVAGTTMRVLGPNCEGLASLPASAPLTFSPVLDAARTGQVVLPGKVAVLSHSGGLGFAVAQWGSRVGIGFNYLISTGNEGDLDVLELAGALLVETDTELAVLVLEGVDDPRRLAALAGQARELGKRLLVARLGRTDAGARGSLAHTRHDATTLGGLDALYAQQGIAQAGDERELIDVLQALDKVPTLAGRRIGILATSGGAGVWLADACRDAGLAVPELSPELQHTLAGFMPEYGSPVNPVDLTAQFIAGGSFAPAIEALASSGEVDAVVLATSLASAGRLEDDREALSALLQRDLPPLVVYTYTHPAESCVRILEGLGLAWYTSSTGVAGGLAAVAPPLAGGTGSPAADDTDARPAGGTLS
ncbi:CoA-binding protein [Plantactinospora solaniradicis]|uniref:CoA-binding protein n=1 Tax=Plantactinospora solaniradicis TaxID=1723736 RepID=A0ABW1KP22_9ACTN